MPVTSEALRQEVLMLPPPWQEASSTQTAEEAEIHIELMEKLQIFKYRPFSKVSISDIPKEAAYFLRDWRPPNAVIVAVGGDQKLIRDYFTANSEAMPINICMYKQTPTNPDLRNNWNGMNKALREVGKTLQDGKVQADLIFISPILAVKSKRQKFLQGWGNAHKIIVDFTSLGYEQDISVPYAGNENYFGTQIANRMKGSLANRPLIQSEEGAVVLSPDDLLHYFAIRSEMYVSIFMK